MVLMWDAKDFLIVAIFYSGCFVLDVLQRSGMMLMMLDAMLVALSLQLACGHSNVE